jgi:hypothetical protein
MTKHLLQINMTVCIDDGMLDYRWISKIERYDSVPIGVTSTNANMTCGDTKDNNQACVFKQQTTSLHESMRCSTNHQLPE